jgi:hypothetical protein
MDILKIIILGTVGIIVYLLINMKWVEDFLRWLKSFRRNKNSNKKLEK